MSEEAEPDSSVMNSEFTNGTGTSESEQIVTFAAMPGVKPGTATETTDEVRMMALSEPKGFNSLYQELITLTEGEYRCSGDREYAKRVMKRAFGCAEYIQLLQKLYPEKPLGRGPCRKVLEGAATYSYRCLDCQENRTSVICQECFDDSDHTGHRVYRDVPGGICDCGEPDLWKPIGSCSQHQGIITEDTVLPADIKNNLSKCIKIGFYVLFQRIETSKELSSTEEYMKTLFADFLEEIRDICEISGSLLRLIIQCIVSPLDDSLGNYEQHDGEKKLTLKMNHSHVDYTDPKPHMVESEDCHCSVLDLLLRHGNKMTLHAQIRLIAHLYYFTVLGEFMPALRISYFKHFMFNYRPLCIDNSIPAAYPLIELSDLLFLTVDKNISIMIEKCNIEVFLVGLEKYVFGFIDDGKPPFRHHEFFMKEIAYSVKSLVSSPSFSAALFTNRHLTATFLRLFTAPEQNRFNFTRASPQTDNDMRSLSHFTSKSLDLCRSNMSLMNVILSMAIENRTDGKRMIENILCALVDSMLSVPSAYGFSTLDISLERMFTLAYTVYLHTDWNNKHHLDIVDYNDGSADAIDKVLWPGEGKQKDRNNFWKEMVEKFASVNGFIREVSRGLWVSLYHSSLSMALWRGSSRRDILIMTWTVWIAWACRYRCSISTLLTVLILPSMLP